MAEQTAIGYEQTKEWQQFQTGGTRVDADDLNRMEGGIVDACDAVDQLRTKRLPTYVVAQDGDTATQDVYMEDILGPCLILDLATRTTYYETGGDEEGHRKAITSGDDIDELRDSLSRIELSSGQIATVRFGYWGDNGQIELLDSANDGFIVSFDSTKMIVFRRESGETKNLGSVRYSQ